MTAVLRRPSGLLVPAGMFKPSTAPPVISIEGTQSVHQTSGTTASVTITTTGSNEPIIAYIASSNGVGSAGLTVTGVSGGGINWQRRKQSYFVSSGGFGDVAEVWYGTASGPLSAQTITATFSGSLTSSHGWLTVFGIKGANGSGFWDSNTSLPAAISNNSGSNVSPTATPISTNNANDVELSFQYGSPATVLAPPSGFTNIQLDPSFGVYQVAYKQLTATQSGASVTGSSASNTNLTVDCVMIDGQAGNDANTQLLVHGDGSLADSSFNNFTPTGHGSIATSTSQKQFGSASIQFTAASSQYVDYGAQSVFNFGTSDFTVEFWMYVSGSQNSYLVSKAGVSGFGPFLAALNTPTTLLIDIGTTGSSWDIANAISMGTVTTSTWHHFALVRHGTAFTGYLDGVGTSLGTSSGSLASNSTKLTFGSDPAGAGFFNGFLDEIRVSNIARWTANFTPPAAPYS